MSGRRWGARLWWELRRAIGWVWLLPLALVIAALAIMAASGTPPAQRPATLREALEIGLPLCAPFLAVPLLESEWARGTVALLAVRASLTWTLLARLAWVGVYLVALVVGGCVATLGMAGGHAPFGADAQWLGATLLIALAPAALLGALALLATSLAVEAAAGYIIGAAFWLLNLIGGLALPGDSVWRAFLLFGWSFAPAGSAAPAWWVGKLALLGIAALLLALQPLLLRSEARFIAQSSD